MKTQDTSFDDSMMSDNVTVSVGMAGGENIYACCFKSGAAQESAYFPAGVPFVVSRRIIRELVMDGKNYPIFIMRDDNPDGTNWFAALFESIERARLTREWKEKYGSYDKFGVAAFIAGSDDNAGIL